MADKYTPRLKKIYNEKIAQELMNEFKLDNINEVPKISKVVVSCGTGQHRDDKHFYSVVKTNLTKITGQEPIDKVAKKSIANFKLRKGMDHVGIMVTLRNSYMYDFIDRLINIALPRVRDFHGVNSKFDKSGNYSIGIKEQSIFPELNFEDTQLLHGLEITFVIKNSNGAMSRKLLEKFGMPFEKKQGGRA